MASPSRHRRPCALLVDDDPFVLAILAERLDECGIDSVRADDGRTGLQVLSDELASVDLVVTDLVMPGVAGDTLVMAVRELGGERELPILVASSYLDEDRARALLQAGADAVVDKGRGLAPVAAAARALLENRGRRAVRVEVEWSGEEPEGRGAVPAGVSVPLFRIGLRRRE